MSGHTDIADWFVGGHLSAMSTRDQIGLTKSFRMYWRAPCEAVLSDVPFLSVVLDASVHPGAVWSVAWLFV